MTLYIRQLSRRVSCWVRSWGCTMRWNLPLDRARSALQCDIGTLGRRLPLHAGIRQDRVSIKTVFRRIKRHFPCAFPHE